MNDALLLEYLAAELNQNLSGGRIDKVNMPEKDEILLSIRAKGQNYKLLISAAAHSPRIHITQHIKENPVTAPAFLMHLRKYISGGVITSINNVKYERVVIINLIHNNELFIPEEIKLVVEIMGKHSNIILLDAKGIISESIRHVSLDMSGKRQVFPSLAYTLPPAQDKLSPDNTAELKRLLAAYTGGKIDNYILTNMCGMAPYCITEAVYRALGTATKDTLTATESDKILLALKNLYTEPARPSVIKKDGVAADFLPYRFLSINAEYEDTTTISEAIDICTHEKDKSLRFTEKARTLLSLLKNRISKDEKKILTLTEVSRDASDCDKYRIYGELILANIYKIKKGDHELVTENFYDENNNMITVPLDTVLSPQLNAQKYFKRYNKNKRTLTHTAEQLMLIEKELDYLYSIQEAFRKCDTVSELNELKKEIESAGLTKKEVQKNKKPKQADAPSSPLHYNINGFDIYAGKNNIQNERLTLKFASPEDIFLHTKNYHGSHVIIVTKSRAVPDEVLLAAAVIAANKSKGYMSNKVDVDYCEVKYIKKPKNTPSGTVIYTNNKNILVDATQCNYKPL